MHLAIALLLPLLTLQDEAASFAKDARVAVALYTPRPDSKPETDVLELTKAGIDVALVDFDGNPESLHALVAACEERRKDKKEAPLLAVYVRPGKDADLGAAERFYERVPPALAARVDGRPIVWLAPAPEGAAPLTAALKRLRRPPYLVSEISWKDAPADRVYALGSLRGFALDHPVVTVGPGTLDREDGKSYERVWTKAIRLEPRMVLIESWNGEADGVSETPERKRKYLDLTHRFVRDYKVNEKVPAPKGKWSSATQVAYTAVYNPHEQGLAPLLTEEGLFDALRLRGFEALSTKQNKRGSVRRLCFDVDDSFCYFETRSFMVAVEFFDVGEGSFSLEYDSGDRTLSTERRLVKSAGSVSFTGTGKWRTETFQLPDAAFGNGQPGGSDFRFSADKRGLTVRSVIVMKK